MSFTNPNEDKSPERNKKWIKYFEKLKTDPYLNEDNCYNRLRNEYVKHGRIIIAVDFDDTIFPYHNTGHTHERVIQLLKECLKTLLPMME